MNTLSEISLMVKLKEKENIITMMAQYMKEIGRMINLQDGEKNYLLMVLHSKAYLKMVLKKKEDLNGMMEVIMMEKLKIIHLKDMGYFIGKKEENIKVLGKEVKCGDLVKLNI